MNSLKDYVDMVAKSMAVKLDDDTLKRIAFALINNENYKMMLEDLEAMINMNREGN